MASIVSGLLVQRPARKEQRLKRANFNRKRTLTVTLILLVGVVALLFAMEETHDGKAPKPSQDAAVSGAVSSGVAQSSAIGSTLWSGLGTVSSVRATLSNDLDHDGNYDGMADPLVALCTLIVLYGRFIVLVMPLVGRLLLRLYKLPILVDSDYCLALERPG